jgi:hypothetical protein
MLTYLKHSIPNMFNFPTIFHASSTYITKVSAECGPSPAQCAWVVASLWLWRLKTDRFMHALLLWVSVGTRQIAAKIPRVKISLPSEQAPFWPRRSWGSTLATDSCEKVEKSQSTLCRRKSSVFSGCSGFLPQGKLTGWVRINIVRKVISQLL